MCIHICACRCFKCVNLQIHNFDNKKVLQNDDFYQSDDGFIVFTENYHLKRGYCCKNNCKHCPYNYKKNDESKRGNKKRDT